MCMKMQFYKNLNTKANALRDTQTSNNQLREILIQIAATSLILWTKQTQQITSQSNSFHKYKQTIFTRKMYLFLTLCIHFTFILNIPQILLHIPRHSNILLIGLRLISFDKCSPNIIPTQLFSIHTIKINYSAVGDGSI